MFKKWSLPIRLQFAILVNLIVVPLVILLAILLYGQFKKVLDERILLQLSSIRQLKSVQIEDFLSQEWNAFKGSIENSIDYSNVDISVGYVVLPSQLDEANQSDWVRLIRNEEPGIHDLSSLSADGSIVIGLSERVDSILYMSVISGAKIQEILLERTGMGATGETYLVGSDLTMRSLSRFMPDTNPILIRAETEGTKQGQNGISGLGVFEDYRGVPVYSSYGPLEQSDLAWIILSEIDVEEVMEPVNRMRERLLIISLVIVLILIFVTFELSDQLTKPLRTMHRLLSQMATGRIDIEIPESRHAQEVNSMFKALEKLKGSIQEAVHFADELGSLNLNKDYNLLSEDDVLGEALIQMRDRLKRFNELEAGHQIEKEKALVRGQENERARLARELHDGLGPLLTSLKMQIREEDMSPDVREEINILINETISEVRKMSYSLMPSSLADFGVGYAISKLVETMRRVSNVDIQFINSLDPGVPLSHDVGLTLYRIIQEALNNALKYARASTIRLSLTQFEDHVSLYFKDDGIGFDTDTTFEGAGIVNMKERCRIMHGDFDIISDETGTQIEVDIPLDNA